jgi:uncharacterized repeat protein (TIGR01451 family)/LPXTG-motif cell wall-anchored protein
VVSKSANPPFAMPGATVTWTIMVSNPGSVPVTNIVVVDDVPAEVEIQNVTSTAGTVTSNGQVVTFTIGALNPGESVTIVIETRVRDDVNVPFIITNRASITNAENPTPRQSEATVTSVSSLPETGETLWVAPLFGLLALIALAGMLWWHRRHS